MVYCACTLCRVKDVGIAVPLNGEHGRRMRASRTTSPDDVASGLRSVPQLPLDRQHGGIAGVIIGAYVTSTVIARVADRQQFQGERNLAPPVGAEHAGH